MRQLECPGLQIHRYYEDIDITKCHHLNEELIKYVHALGWDIKDKIAEGSSADVFTVVKGELEAVLIIQGNQGGFDANLDNEISFAKDHPNVFPKIYDYFQVNIPYSTDDDYLNSSGNFENKTIQIMEKMDMTLEQFLYKAKKEMNNVDFERLCKLIKKNLTKSLKEIYDNDATYTDIKFDNFGVNDKGCEIKFLDIESIKFLSSKNFNSKKAINIMFRHEIAAL